VDLQNLQAVADEGYLKVSFDVVNAPGAYYEVAVKDSNGALIGTATGNAITVGTNRIIPIELSFEVPGFAQAYTVEVTAKDIYDHTKVISSGSSMELNISLSPEGDGNFIVVKQGVPTPLTVKITGPVETTTITLSKSIVVDGSLTATIVKQKSFSEAVFSDPEFFDANLEAGRYQLTVEAKSALGQVAVVTRRVIVDGDVPKLDGVDVMSDDGEIVVEKQMTDHSIDLIVRTEDNTTGQIVLKASDESSAFVVYLDGEELGSWGDPGAGGEGTFFVPIAINLGLDEMHTVKVVDEAGHSAEYFFRLRVTNMAGDLPPVVGNVLMKLDGQEIRPNNGGTYTVVVESLPAEAVLTFSAIDDKGIDRIAVKVNGEQVADGSPAIFSLVEDENVIEITAEDSAGQVEKFAFTMVVIEEGATGVSFYLNLPAGETYFGFPIKVDKTIAEIIPGVNVYRIDGNNYVLANNEKPQPFAVYRADLDHGVFVELIGDKFKRSTITVPAGESVYISIPIIQPVDAYGLFGSALVTLRELRYNGLPMPVEDGMMKPGKAYLVVVSEPVTITLP